MFGSATALIVIAQATSASPVTIEVSDPSCPSEGELRALAERRLPERGDPSRSLVAKLASFEGGFTATVDVVDRPSGKILASRTLEGSTCQDVASAMLLLLALSSTEELETPQLETPKQNDERTVDDRRLDRSPSSDVGTTHPSSRGRLAFHGAALSALAGGAGPVAVGGGVRVAVARESDDLFRPEVSVGVDAFTNATIAGASGTAHRSLFVGRADLCPLGIGPSRLVVRLCASGALGEIRVRGENVPRTKDEGRLYATLGASVRARMPVVSKLGVEIAAGWLAPLYRHRFFFESNETLVTLTPAPFVEGGLAWSIP